MKLSESIGQFTAVPNWVLGMIPEIGMDGLTMYAYLLMRQGKNGSCFPAYDTMQSDLGVSRAKISRLLKILVAAGLIIKKRRFSASTIYTVISSEIELMQSSSLENELPISSEIEPPLVQNVDANKIQLNRLDKCSSSKDNDDELEYKPGPLALLNDAYTNTTKMSAFDNLPKNVEAGKRMIAAGVTPEILIAATEELLAKGFTKLMGLSSLETACEFEKGKRKRKYKPKKEKFVEVHK